MDSMATQQILNQGGVQRRGVVDRPPVRIRSATIGDLFAIHEVHQSAFDGAEGDLTSDLAIRLLTETASPAVVSLVAEEDDLVGHVAFSPIRRAGTREVEGYLLAPLGVKRAFQGKGVGAALVEAGLQHVARLGLRVLLVYGDPAYYGRFGFSQERAASFIPPYKLRYPFGWQAHTFDRGKSFVRPHLIECSPSLEDPALW